MFHQTERVSITSTLVRRTDRVCAADEAPAQASMLDLIREAGYICARRFRAIVMLPAANRDCGTPRLNQCGAV